MNHINEYIEQTKEYISQNPDLTEQEKIMKVYLDLGQRFRFNSDFFFGGSKKKKELYEHSFSEQTIEDCFENNLIICRSISNIMTRILTELGISAKSFIDSEDTRKYKHVYNVITPADGSEQYSIDLQEDIIYMHYHAFTKNFGLCTYNPNNYVISREEQKQMHTKFGYISPTNPYVDDYIYLFKQTLPMFRNFHDKIDFVLKNIDPYEYSNVDYWERRWKHDRFLKQLFDPFELSDKLHLVEFYKQGNDGNKDFINGFFTYPNGGTRVYMFSKETGQYESYNLKEFALKVNTEGIRYNQEIMGLKKELHKIQKATKEKEER